MLSFPMLPLQQSATVVPCFPWSSFGAPAVGPAFTTLPLEWYAPISSSLFNPTPVSTPMITVPLASSSVYPPLPTLSVSGSGVPATAAAPIPAASPASPRHSSVRSPPRQSSLKSPSKQPARPLVSDSIRSPVRPLRPTAGSVETPSATARRSRSAPSREGRTPRVRSPRPERCTRCGSVGPATTRPVRTSTKLAAVFFSHALGKPWKERTARPDAAFSSTSARTDIFRTIPWISDSYPPTTSTFSGSANNPSTSMRSAVPRFPPPLPSYEEPMPPPGSYDPDPWPAPMGRPLRSPGDDGRSGSSPAKGGRDLGFGTRAQRKLWADPDDVPGPGMYDVF
eukprot:RCo014648